MSSRPIPRRSGLAGKSPVIPPVSAVPTPGENDRSAGTSPPKRDTEAKKRKVSFYQDEDRTARARGAHLHTMAQEGSRSLSDFIDKAVMAAVEQLEAKHNDGKPFPSVKAGGIPQGRPMGE